MKEIKTILSDYDNVDQALDDLKGNHALMMCLLQIGEKMNKIESPDIRKKLPVKGSYRLRNIIIHEYEGVLLSEVKQILTTELAPLKDIINSISDDIRE